MGCKHCTKQGYDRTDTIRLLLSVTSVFNTAPMLADCMASLTTRLGAVYRVVHVHSDTPKIDDNMGMPVTGPRCQHIAERSQNSMICHCDRYSTSDARGHSSCCSCKDLCSWDHRPQTFEQGRQAYHKATFGRPSWVLPCRLGRTIHCV